MAKNMLPRIQCSKCQGTGETDAAPHLAHTLELMGEGEVTSEVLLNRLTKELGRGSLTLTAVINRLNELIALQAVTRRKQGKGYLYKKA